MYQTGQRLEAQHMLAAMWSTVRSNRVVASSVCNDGLPSPQQRGQYSQRTPDYAARISEAVRHHYWRMDTSARQWFARHVNSTFDALKRRTFSFTKNLKVDIFREEAVDDGGQRREVLRYVNWLPHGDAHCFYLDFICARNYLHWPEMYIVGYYYCSYCSEKSWSLRLNEMVSSWWDSASSTSKYDISDLLQSDHIQGVHKYWRRKEHQWDQKYSLHVNVSHCKHCSALQGSTSL